MTTYPVPTRDDVGRKVASVRGIDWTWRACWDDDVIVHDVHHGLRGTQVQIGHRAGPAYWYAARDIKLWRPPDEE